MSLEFIVASDYGQVIEITFIDVDTDAAANISGYTTTKSMIFTSPAGVATTKAATFKTDGSDGIIQYTVEAAFLTAGSWHVRGQVKKAAATLSTQNYNFIVES